MASDQIDWPDQTQPGVPLNPDKRGWHWLGFKGQHEAEREPWAWLWSDEDGATGEFGWMTDDDGDPERMARHYTYIAPIATPADLAARVEAERVRVTEHACAVIDANDEYDQRLCCDGRECGCQGATVHQQMQHYIRALGPTPAYDAAIKAAEARGMEAAAVIARCQIDGRPRLPESIDWQDGYERGCRDAEEAIRAAAGGGE